MKISLLNNKKAMASTQLIILLAATFAFAFLVYQATPVVGQSIMSEPSMCCEKTTEGAWCINTDETNCDAGFKKSPTSCESTSYCKLGTCYDSGEGICIENTPQRVCDDQDGTWDEREIENVPQCQLGCCIIADQAAFVSLVRCKRLSSLFGIENDYRTDITNEIDCIAEAQSQDMGACVYEQDFERTCKFTTRKDCGAGSIVETVNGTNVSLSSEKKFYKNYLCSAEELNTACARQASTGCYQGKVYWLDSCGNRENVYSSDKTKSWNSGKVAEPWEVCDANDGSDKNCGNCDYLLGSRCAKWEGILGIGKPVDSDYICRKTTCVDRNGEERINGESWCVYDASTGLGTDPVGSRHYKEVCVDGDVRVEPCADFRQEVCIQGSITTEEGDGDFSTAACRNNRWQDCVSQDSESCTNINKRDCILLPPVAGLKFGVLDFSGKTFSRPSSGGKFSGTTGGTITGGVITGMASDDNDDDDDDNKWATPTNRPEGVCVPDFPPGLDFWQEGEAQGICGQVSAYCIAVFEETKLGGSKCIENCECLEESWGQAMNAVCTSLGDCGGYVNYIGKFTEDGYEWTKDGQAKTLSPNTVNQIKREGSSGGGKSDSLSFGTVAGIAAIVALVAGIGGQAGKLGFLGGTPTTTLLPNLANLNLVKEVNLGGITKSLGVDTNWLARGAWNALIVGGVVYLGARMLGKSKETANALGTSVAVGVFAGEAAGAAAANYGTKTLKSGAEIAKAFNLKTPTGVPSTVDINALKEAGFKLAEDGLSATNANGEIINIAEGGSELAMDLVGGTKQTWLGANAGLINLGVTIGIAILVYQLTKKDYEAEVVTFSCQPWQAPTGGNDCEKCNDPDLPCSEYRCKSLGQACELVNAGSDKEKCVYINPRDTNPPIITPNEEELTLGYEYTNVKPNPPNAGLEIVNTESNEGCVRAFEKLKFGIDTNEPAQCRIDTEHKKSFDEMSNWFGGTNLYLYNHTEQLSLPGSDAFSNGSLILKNGNEMNLYIRCMDKNGNTNDADYNVRFCVDETPDNTAPQIKATSIVNGGCVAANTDTASVEFYVDEPADCRWSKQDQSYALMPNSMVCSTQTYQINALQLYTCKAELTGISRNEETFYVRCKDQPDKPENERNENKQSYEFSLRGSTDLKMKNLKPNATIFGAVDPAPVELYVETLFGCDDGKAICYYSTSGSDSDYIAFFDTNTNDGIHTQRQDLGAGTHTYYYKCVDSGGNVAINTTTFKLDIDTSAPVVARIYEEDNMLKIVTVRNSECAYSFDNCDFTFAEGTVMPYANSTNHVAEWKEDKTYYIKCRDEFRNEEADCSVVVRPTRDFL